MSNQPSTSNAQIRIFFRGSSPLDRHVRAVAQKQRAPLIKQLAGDFLALQRAHYVFPVNLEPSAGNGRIEPDGPGHAPIGVRVTFVGDSPLDEMFRAMPCSTPLECAHRIATLRQLAENGFAVASRGIRHDAVVLREEPAGGLVVTRSDGASPTPAVAPSAAARQPAVSSWSRAITLEESHSDHGQEGYSAFDLQVAIA